VTGHGAHHVSLEAATLLAPNARSNSSGRLFSDVSVSAQAGRSLVLLGPNGCGKTSVARAIVGLAPVSSGRRLARAGVHFAYMPQDYRNAFFPWLSIQANVSLRLRRSPPDREDETAAHVLTTEEMLSLGHRLDLDVDLNRYPDQVSGGQLQLVLFLTTIVMPGNVRVLDEPFSALDFRRRSIASEVMSERVAATPEEAWVVVTHDIGEGVQLADELAVFSTGRTILTRIPVGLAWPRGFGVREDPAGLSAIHAVRKAVGVA